MFMAIAALGVRTAWTHEGWRIRTRVYQGDWQTAEKELLEAVFPAAGVPLYAQALVQQLDPIQKLNRHALLGHTGHVGEWRLVG